MTGKHNEDSYGFFAWQIDQERDLHLAIVADGIGGQAAGERASTLAVKTICDFFTAQRDIKDLPAKMAESIRQANDAIVAASAEDQKLRGMGTTIVMTALVEDRLYTAYVGDSRIYLLREGRLQQLTIDHTWAQEAIEAGLLTRQEAKTHPNRNVIKRYLGNANGVEVDHRLVLGPSQSGAATIRNQGVVLRTGDVLLLNSDGLNDMIDDTVIQSALENRQTLQTAVHELIDKANEAGGKDNITVVAVGIPAQDGTLPINKAVPAVAAAPATQAQTAKVQAVPTDQPKAWPWMLIAGILGLILVVVLAAGAAFFFLGGERMVRIPKRRQPLPQRQHQPRPRPVMTSIWMPDLQPACAMLKKPGAVTARRATIRTLKQPLGLCRHWQQPSPRRPHHVRSSSRLPIHQFQKSRLKMAVVVAIRLLS